MQVSPGRFLPLLDEEIVNVFVGEKTSADVDSGRKRRKYFLSGLSASVIVIQAEVESAWHVLQHLDCRLRIDAGI